MASQTDELLKKIMSTLTDLDRELASFSSSTSNTASELKYYKTIYDEEFKPKLVETERRLKNLPIELIQKVAEEKPQFKTALSFPIDLSENVKLLNEEAFEQIDTQLDIAKGIVKPDLSGTKMKSSQPRNKFKEIVENSSRNKNVVKPKTNKTFSRDRGDHPYQAVIENMQLPIKEYYEEDFDLKVFDDRDFEDVPCHWIETEEQLEEMIGKLQRENVIAVDLEHHNFHSYVGLLSLMQISTAHEDFLVDVIKLREVLQSSATSLNRIFANPAILKLFHGAESDIAWLQRDFDAFIVNMFDTYHAARILELGRFSLAFLLERYCDVELDKKYQLADWRERPLPEEMVEYARKDTHYLIKLYHLMRNELTFEQFALVIKKSNEQCLVLYEPEIVSDKAWRSVIDKASVPLDYAQVAAVKQVFYWREETAKKLDVSPAAIMPNGSIVRVAYARAKSAWDVKGCLSYVSEFLKDEMKNLVVLLEGCFGESAEVEREFVDITPKAEIKRTHIRYSDEEETEKESAIKTAKVEEAATEVVESFEETMNVAESAAPVIFTPLTETRKPIRVSFAKHKSESVIGSVLTSSKRSDSDQLKELMRETLPKIKSDEFLTKAELEARAKKAAEEERLRLEEEKRAREAIEKPSVIVHATKLIVEDVEKFLDESVHGNKSDPSTMIKKMQKPVKSKASASKIEIKPFDYSNVQANDSAKNEPAVFDPFKTLKADEVESEAKQPFLVEEIKGARGPRLTTAPASGNRQMTFHKKNRN